MSWISIGPGIFVTVMAFLAAVLTLLEQPKKKIGKAVAIFVFGVLAGLEIRAVRREQKTGEDHYDTLIGHFQRVEVSQGDLNGQQGKILSSYSDTATRDKISPIVVTADALSIDILTFLYQRSVSAPLDPKVLPDYNRQTVELFQGQFGSRIVSLRTAAAKAGIPIPQLPTAPTSVTDVTKLAQAIGSVPADPYADWSNARLREYTLSFAKELKNFADDYAGREMVFQADISVSSHGADMKKGQEYRETAERGWTQLRQEKSADYANNYHGKAKGLEITLLKRLKASTPVPDPLDNPQAGNSPYGMTAVVRQLEELANRLGGS